MDTNSAVDALAALAQPSRLALFRHLVALAPGSTTPGTLAEQLGIPPNTLSFHLKTLLRAGLIESEPQGRFIRYRASTAQMQQLIDFLSSQCCAGDPSRCAPGRRRARH